jgi:hypothetical protein
LRSNLKGRLWALVEVSRLQKMRKQSGKIDASAKTCFRLESLSNIGCASYSWTGSKAADESETKGYK